MVMLYFGWLTMCFSYNDMVITEADGEIIKARIPTGVPYRTTCKIGLVVWPQLFNHNKLYSVSYYPDCPQTH
jgi:hypothetical protein